VSCSASKDRNLETIKERFVYYYCTECNAPRTGPMPNPPPRFADDWTRGEDGEWLPESDICESCWVVIDPVMDAWEDELPHLAWELVRAKLAVVAERRRIEILEAFEAEIAEAQGDLESLRPRARLGRVR
jgi:hypothetical protein